MFLVSKVTGAEGLTEAAIFSASWATASFHDFGKETPDCA
jgi:hypothetical protein